MAQASLVAHQEAEMGLDLALKHQDGHRNKVCSFLYVSPGNAVEQNTGGHWQACYYISASFRNAAETPDRAIARSEP